MATRSQEVLNVAGQSVTMYTGGKAYVGIRLAGTWVGTVQFEGSTDGLTFIAMSMTPFASGTDVSSATANGNWFAGAKNYIAVRARVSAYTSGSINVYGAVSTDQSYQDAFLAPSTLHVNSSATSGVNTLTQAAQTNRAWRLKHLRMGISGPDVSGGILKVQIFDGDVITGTILYSTFLSDIAGSVGREYEVPLPPDTDREPGGIIGTPGSAMTIRLLGPGTTMATEINAAFSAA